MLNVTTGEVPYTWVPGPLRRSAAQEHFATADQDSRSHCMNCGIRRSHTESVPHRVQERASFDERRRSRVGGRPDSAFGIGIPALAAGADLDPANDVAVRIHQIGLAPGVTH